MDTLRLGRSLQFTSLNLPNRLIGPKHLIFGDERRLKGEINFFMERRFLYETMYTFCPSLLFALFNSMFQLLMLYATVGNNATVHHFISPLETLMIRFINSTM